MKRLSRTFAVWVIVILCFAQNVFSQDQGSVYSIIINVPDKLFKRINDKTSDINDGITNQTERYLDRLAREEKRLKRKLAKKDSTAAKQIFGDADKQYTQWQEDMRNASAQTTRLSKKYIPRLDSLQTAMQFLKKSEGLLKDVPGSKAKLEQAIGNMDVLQDKFSQAEEVENFLKNRRQFLQEQLGRFGLVDDLQKYKKQVYYYQAQVEDYKKTFEDPSRLEAKAMELLRQTKVFKDFFNKHSQLAGLFSLPGSEPVNYVVSFAGLQTQNGVQQSLVQRFGSPVNIQQMAQQQVPSGQAQLNQLKEKINQLGGSNSDMEMPDFKPNNQKTKRLKNRLEFGTNLQTVKSNRFFPSTSDIGLSLGYKLNDKSTVGLGGSYKVGWGKDIRHITISHQGIGVRSFIDYKIKASFWLSGGGEINYRSQFSNFEILNDYSAWQKSALIGVSKKYKVSKKVKGNAQLMYDFLWKEQVPRTQPVLFRVGYNLN